MGAEEIRQKLLPRFREMTADRVEKISTALLQLERGTASGGAAARSWRASSTRSRARPG